MMESRVSPQISRFAALGLAAVVAVAVFGFVLEPVVSRIVGLEGEIQAKREHLGRLAAIAARMSDAPGSAGQASRMLAAVTLEGETEAIQLANLQTAVGRAAEAAGVRLRSTQALPVLQRDEFAFAGLQSTAQVRLEALQRLLHGLEVHRPMLIIDAIDMAPLNGSGGPEGGDDRVLQVNFRVRALVAATKKGTGQ